MSWTKAPVTTVSVFPSDDAIRVCAFRKILSMSEDERATVSVKVLRQQLEQVFCLDEGSLKEKKHVLLDVALACNKAIAAPS